MLNKITTKKIKAFGLVEILVSLVIYGVAVIAVTSLTINSYRTIKDSELSDFANSVMVRGVEYFKSADTLTILPTSGKKSFIISSDLGNPSSPFSMTEIPGITDKITACSTGSQFHVTISGNEGFLLCNQILISKLSSNDYLIDSVIVFQLSRRVEQTELLGFRPRIEE